MIEDRVVLLRRADKPEARLPQVIAGGSGDTTPYRLSVTRSETRRRVTLIGDADGMLDIERPSAP